MDSTQSEQPPPNGRHPAIEGLFKLINVVAWICFVTMLAVMLIQVFTRYVFNHPLPWTEELSRFSYVWAIFLGAILAQRSKSHMTVTILTESLPRRAQTVLALFSDLFSVLVMCVVLYGTFIQMRKTYGILASSIPVSYTYIYLALAIGAAGMLVLLVLSFIRELRAVMRGKS